MSSIFHPRKWWVLAFVVNTHERPLLNFALRLTRNREDAYDLLQAQYNKSVNLPKYKLTPKAASCDTRGKWG